MMSKMEEGVVVLPIHFYCACQGCCFCVSSRLIVSRVECNLIVAIRTRFSWTHALPFPLATTATNSRSSSIIDKTVDSMNQHTTQQSNHTHRTQAQLLFFTQMTAATGLYLVFWVIPVTL
eukprot:m.23528 g.23528  ORF g.23528 m.23528 type:complete len:120 (-) comp8515_c0_seq1:1110-1469(-)